jgi:hypothetical protein
MVLGSLHAAHVEGRSWTESREEAVMDLLAFLGRAGYQSADSLARHRSVRWLYRLAASVGKLLQAESDAIERAQRSSGGS